MNNTSQRNGKNKQNTGYQFDIYSRGGTLKTLFLPFSNNGIFRFDIDETALEHQEISFENRSGDWRIICSEQARFLDGSSGNWRRLREDSQFNIEALGKQIVLFVRNKQIEDYIYRKLILNPGGRITIGRSFNCDIEIVSQRASRQHSELTWDGTSFEIRDLNSSNGVFINGRKVSSKKLRLLQ